MIEQITNVAVGGILALLVLREVFGYLHKRKNGDNGGSGRRNTDKIKGVQSAVDAVLSRMDRIIERLDDIKAATKAVRRQTEITLEQTQRTCRCVNQLETAINRLEAERRRTAETYPGT